LSLDEEAWEQERVVMVRSIAATLARLRVMHVRVYTPLEVRYGVMEGCGGRRGEGTMEGSSLCMHF
jgi:hypothetical protein